MNPLVSRLIAFAFPSFFLLAVPYVMHASPPVVHVFVALADNQHHGLPDVRAEERLAGAGQDNCPALLSSLGSGSGRNLKVHESIMSDGAEPLLWTTGLMAPEAYTLKAALDGWIAGEDDESIRQCAAEAYDKYQKRGARAALKLFSANW